MAKLRWDKVQSGTDVLPDPTAGPLHAYRTADVTGTPKPCKFCGQTIVLCKSNGRWAPYNPGGARHTCAIDKVNFRQIARGLQ